MTIKSKDHIEILCICLEEDILTGCLFKVCKVVNVCWTSLSWIACHNDGSMQVLMCVADMKNH